MPSRNKSARAHSRLELETPISDDANLLICKSKSKTLFAKQSVVIHQNLMS